MADPRPRRRPVRRFRQLRRQRLHPLWHAIRPIAVLGFIGLVLVLGTIGFHTLPGKDYSVLDALYLTLGLFTLGGNVEPLNTELQIARLLAPVVTGYAVIRTVTLLFRDNFELLRIRLYMHDHVVVAGLGRTGARLVRALDEADHRVVGIERNALSPAIEAARDAGVSALAGDATDPLTLSRARIGRARHLIVACGDDRTDMDVAAAAADVERASGRALLNALVTLEDLRLWRLLTARTLGHSGGARVRLDVLHVHDAAARLLVERHPPFDAGADGDRPAVALVGFDGVAESLLLQTARLWAGERPTSDARLPVTVVGPDATDQVERLALRHPRLLGICDLDAEQTPLEGVGLTGAVRLAKTRGERCTAYVCLEPEGDALAAGLALATEPALGDVPIVVTVDDEDAGVASVIDDTRSRTPNLETFGVLSSTLTPELLFGGTHEAVARARHEGYRRQYPGTESARPWEELPEDLREANRGFVDGIGAKLEAIGMTIIPDPLADPDDVPAVPADLVEPLAIAEHDRWVAEKASLGWQLGPRDNDAKRHPCMVPWEELSEEDKDKDRVFVRELPRTLAEGGFALVPTAGGPAAQPEKLAR